MSLELPKNYKSSFSSIKERSTAIKSVKDGFERELSSALNLTRVSAPLFVFPKSGINDDLNGVERPVKFDVKNIDEEVEVVHSLAKWKRMALHKYGFSVGEGLYADMNAIRRDEDLDNLHSVYVDQWDWEKVLNKEDRTVETLKNTVNTIFGVFKKMEEKVNNQYPQIEKILPDEVYYITTQELEDMYPDLTPRQREDEITRKYKAVFIMQIGDLLKSGIKHDGRAPDYDDWKLNGDLIFWYPVLEHTFEVSSMGIRVDEDSLVEQLKKAGCEHRLDMPFHQGILNKELPYTIGGGIGQSRVCMFLLRAAHIGEVQSSVWYKPMIEDCKRNNIELL